MLHRVLVATALCCASLSAGATPLTFTNEGVTGQTTVFRAALGGGGQIGSLVISDSNSGVGGSPGTFSGFDLDFVFIDLDGDIGTAGDRVFGSVFNFTTGAIRPTADPAFQPTLARLGPTIGSPAANSIDFGLATLDTLDGSYPDPGFNTDNVSGWLTLGDGGSLAVGLAAPLPLTGSEALFLGEVGLAPGELVSASVRISPSTIPEPATVALLGLGLLAVSMYRAGRRRRALPARR